MKPRDLEKKVMRIMQKAGYLVDQAFYNVKHLPNGKVIANKVEPNGKVIANKVEPKGKIIANKVDFAHVFDLIGYQQDKPILLVQVCLYSKIKQHFDKIDRLFHMHSCPQFRVLLVGIIVDKTKKRNKYVLKFYERIPKMWISIADLC